MKTVTWNREDGYVSVVLFENKQSAAVSTKVYKTKKGAESANKKLVDICGDNYENQNFPWTTTNIETGEKVVNYKSENLTDV